MTAPPAAGSRFPSQILLSGLGLILREWADDDLPVLVELFDEPQVDRWTPLRSPFDLAAARAYLHTARQRRANDLRIQLAITTDGHRPVGRFCCFAAVPTVRPNSRTRSVPSTVTGAWPHEPYR